MIVKKLLLLDGDIFAFQAATLSEYEHWFDEDTVILQSDFAQAKRIAKDNMNKMKERLKADDIIFVYSCPSKKYWRHDMLPTYKGKRTGRPPIALKELKEWLAEEFESIFIENLEADDVMGILATNPDFAPEYDRKIIVSIDKDMQTIPAWIYNPDKDYQEWKQTEDAATRFWLAQSIAGDTTDCYSGVTGIGWDRAMTFLDEPYITETYEHVFKSGKRKGEVEERKRKEPTDDFKSAYLSLFEAAGQTPQDAKANYNVARILRHSDYNAKTKKIKLPLLKDVTYD